MRHGLALLFAASSAAAQSVVLNHQGLLTGADDQPIVAAVEITVAIYPNEDPDPNDAVWSATYALTPYKGLYAIALGDARDKTGTRKTLDGALLAGDRWLGVRVGTEAEFRPLFKIGSVPRAVSASVADALDAAATIDGATQVTGKVPSAVHADSAAALDGAVTVSAAQITGKVASATHADTATHADSAAALDAASKIDGPTQVNGKVPAAVHADAAATLDLPIGQAGGVLNDTSNPLDWSRLKSVPAGFADGVDDGFSQVTLGTNSGLTGKGNATEPLAVDFGTSGTQAKAARADHTHGSFVETRALSDTPQAASFNLTSGSLGFLQLRPGAAPSATLAAGMVYYDQASQTLRFYDGTRWIVVGGQVPANATGSSCKAIKTAYPWAPSGLYTITPPSGQAYPAYCEMVTDGGGWTLHYAYKNGVPRVRFDTTTSDCPNPQYDCLRRLHSSRTESNTEFASTCRGAMIKFRTTQYPVRLMRDGTTFANNVGTGYSTISNYTVLYGTIPENPDTFYAGTNGPGWFIHTYATGSGTHVFSSGYSGGYDGCVNVLDNTETAALYWREF
jgi:hypothetical protein